MQRSFGHAYIGFLAAVVLSASACSESGSEPQVGSPAQMDIVSGEDQAGSAGAELPNPLVVKVVDNRGRGVRDQVVNFRVTAGGGSVFAGVGITNASGIAQERWTLGTEAGALQQLEARAVDPRTGAPLVFATFTARARPGAGASLIVVAGDGQSAMAGSPVAIPPAVRVLDAHGNRVPGATVHFAVVSGGGTVADATRTSDADGLATVGAWTLGAPGPNSLTASSAAIPPVTFVARARSTTPARVLPTAGDGQSATVGTAVSVAPRVVVQNEEGDPLAGVVVTFTPGSGSGSVTGGTATTDAAGAATVGSWAVGTAAGPQSLAATAGAAAYTFTSHATPGAPAALLKTAGDEEIGFAGRAVVIRPSVTVRDAHGNPVPGVQVTFAVTSGGGSVTGASPLTNVNGIATVGSWTLGPTLTGTQTLGASVPGVPAVEFTVTTKPRVAVRMISHPDNPQSALLGSQITLAVIAIDEVGDGMAGVPVTFAPIVSMWGQGTLLSPSLVTTNSVGVASVRYQLSFRIATGVIASSSGLSDEWLLVGLLMGEAHHLSVQLPTTQVVAGGDLGRPSFAVVDQYGNHIPSYPVTFTVTAGGGTVDGLSEKGQWTAYPPPGSGPRVMTTGPLWRSGPVPGVNTLTISANGVPSIVLTRTTQPPP